MRKAQQARKSQIQRSSRLSKKAELLSKQARRIAKLACGIGLLGCLIGIAGSVYGVLTSPADITPIAIWLIISIVAWTLVGIAQGVLNTAILYKKNEREEDLTAKCRIAYLVVGFGCGFILLATAGLWTFNGSFDDPAVTSNMLKTLLALEIILFFSSTGGSMILYHQYYKRIRFINAQETNRRRKKNKLKNRNRVTQSRRAGDDSSDSPPPYNYESSPSSPQRSRTGSDSRTGGRNDNEQNSQDFEPAVSAQDHHQLYRDILQFGEELRRDAENRRKREDGPKKPELEEQFYGGGSGPWTPETLPYSGQLTTAQYLGMR